MREHSQRETEGRARRAIEPEHRVRGQPREDAARPLAAKREPGEHRRRRRGPRTETGQRDQVRGEVQRAEQVLEQRLRVGDERREQPPPPGVVVAETGRGSFRRALEQDRGPVVERVRERRGRLDPLDAVLRERQRAKERRRDPERVDRRADVVDEARQRQLGRPRASANRVGGLEDAYSDTGPRQHDRRGEPVRPGTDHDRVRHGSSLVFATGPVVACPRRANEDKESERWRQCGAGRGWRCGT